MSKKLTLTVTIEDVTREVDRAAYVSAKTKQLVAFGYRTLTEQEVDAQITALLEHKKFGDGLTAIGMFMEDEIVVL